MKIGILTHYYNSFNYGGNLQAYALVTSLIESGYDAEQICYQRTNDFIFGHNPTPTIKCVQLAKKIINTVRKRNIYKRERCIIGFNRNTIVHSDKIFTKNELDIIGNGYDVLIVGSDQVWHPQAVCDAYLLNFPSEAKRIAYAASFAVNELDREVVDYYRPCLKRFKSISVRETTGSELLHKSLGIDANVVLDPVFLLARERWEMVVENREINEPYVLCYFLGAGADEREAARTIANQNRLAIVNLPYLSGKNISDRGFGKYKLFDVTPGQLLGLISNAACVITDSFHASAFSILFHKPFVVFDRMTGNVRSGMESRIDTLLNTFRLQNCKGDIFNPSGMPTDCDWDKVETILAQKRKESMDFLVNALQ